MLQQQQQQRKEITKHKYTQLREAICCSNNETLYRKKNDEINYKSLGIEYELMEHDK